MADQNNNTIGSLSDFSILAERLAGSNKSTKTTEKLNKNIESLNKNILSLAKKLIPATGIGSDIAGISSERRTFLSPAERIRDRLFGRGDKSLRSRFGTARGLLNTLGIVSKGSGSIADEMLERRESRQQFIADQLRVNPQMTDTTANRLTFGKKFDTQQKIQGKLNKTQDEINRLSASGFTEKQIGRTGLFKQRDEQAAKLVASDNRLFNKVLDHPTAQGQSRTGVLDNGSVRAVESFGPSALIGGPTDEETINEQEIIQDKILEAQQQIVKNTADTVAALEAEPGKIVEQKNSSAFGWLKGLLGTIGGFLLSKMTGIVGMLTSGISLVLSPILKMLGIGTAAKVAAGVGTAATAATAAAATKGATSIGGKIKNLVKFVAPKLGTAAKIAGGLLLSKPALIAAAIAGAGTIGYSMLPDSVKDTIGSTVSKFFGDDEEEAKVTKNIIDEQAKIEKTSTGKLGDIITEKSEEIERKGMKSTTEPATIISAPTTNNSSSVVNNHVMSNPRNNEISFNRYLGNRFSVA